MLLVVLQPGAPMCAPELSILCVPNIAIRHSFHQPLQLCPAYDSSQHIYADDMPLIAEANAAPIPEGAASIISCLVDNAFSTEVGIVARQLHMKLYQCGKTMR